MVTVYAVTLETDDEDDGAAIDYTWDEIEAEEANLPHLQRQYDHIAYSEQEAMEWACEQLAPLERCTLCGNWHRADRPNPCRCQVCGYPNSDGHWHPDHHDPATDQRQDEDEMRYPWP